jgi:hypothetical protein
MPDEAEKRGELIRHLEEALALADEIEDGQTGISNHRYCLAAMWSAMKAASLPTPASNAELRA